MTDDLTTDLIRFLRRYCEGAVAELAQHYPEEQRSLYVDYDDLYRYDHELAEDYLEQPDQIREYFEEALRLYDLPADVQLGDAHVRVHNLPDQRTVDVDEVARHERLGELHAIRGQVQKVSQVKPRPVEAAFECQRCGTMTYVPQAGESLQTPHECQGCERQGPFEMQADQTEWTNHQLIRVQEPPENMQGGNADHVDIHMEDDLIAQFATGDRVTVTGVLDIDGQDMDSLDFDTTVRGQAARTEETDYEDINVDEHLEEIEAIANGDRGDPYGLLVDSINPKHHGDEIIKLAIALQLFGGWAHEYPDGSRDRGDWHMLLLGDPGSGKSTFLRSVDAIAPTSTYASGQGASAAGMTAAAVSDDFGDSEWGLEAGALVLADEGVACVDEIDKIDEKAVSSMHDALESQQVHINKAGINTQLNARTSLLAAGNPKQGRFDPYRPFGEQIDMPPTLLSRFDLMFMVSDDPDAEEDADVVGHMFEGRTAAGRHTLGEELTDEERDRVEPAIDHDVLRAYIAHAKQTCYPIPASEEVKDRLSEWFVEFRKRASGEDQSVPLTYRKVEAIQRIAESSARVRLSDTVELEDIQRAITLVTESMKQVGYDPETEQFDADIVHTGSSMSQKQRRQKILSKIEDADGISVDELQSDLDVESDMLDHDIQTLKDQGDIYESNDELRSTL